MREIQLIQYKVCIFNKIEPQAMSTVTVNISFQDSLLNEIDKTAKREHRSRSELIREAARLYIQRQYQWNDLFQLGDRISQEQQLTIKNVEEEIAATRKKNADNQ